MSADNDKVVILGANGVMGAAVAAVFAGGGYNVIMLARDRDKAAQALEAAKAVARAEAVALRVTLGTYDGDMRRAVGEASLVFEALAEDLVLKREFFKRVDAWRRPEAVVATNSSGLSITEMGRGMSDSFRRNFLGIHMYNPPHIIVGTELIPHPETDAEVLRRVAATLARRFGRKVIVAADRPAFVGNRVGFRVMNEVAQLAEEHGVAFIDYLVGPHTGRAMAPLSTVDLVGWDVHKAIVDNVHAHCQDAARDCFKLPAYMERGIADGRLGDKTADKGGFYRRAAGRTVEVLDPQKGAYQPYIPPRQIEFVERMKTLNRVGRYGDAMTVLATTPGMQADLARKVVLGYVSYALNLVGEVAHSPADVDTIMSYGFNWAPPCVIVDLIGPRNALELMNRNGLAVPPAVEQAAAKGTKLFAGGVLEYGRTFVGFG
ncbi:MAG: 3-hydroxyacyl-CoA dehydrogenase family protein [Candidatus Binataceae bacterium]